MTTAARIRGAETSVLTDIDGTLQDQITDVESFESEDMLEIISKGYLGENTERKDMIFKGCKFSGKMHIHSSQFSTFKSAVVNKAKRIVPNTLFNISVVFAFPSGETVTKTFGDCSFGPFKTSASARADYVNVDFSGEVGDAIETVS